MNSSILIVEDEAVVALDLQAQLEGMGYSVVGTAATGAQALALTHSHRPHLILMDVRLKGEMDGISVAQVVTRKFGTPVVFLTSYSDNQTVDRAAQTAPYGYLTKPFQIRELRAVVEVALAKSAMERQLKESERWFSRTLCCVQDAVVVTEVNAHVRFINLAAEAMLGWTSQEAQGRRVDEVLQFQPKTMDGKPDSTRSGAVRALEEGQAIAPEYGRVLQSRTGDVRIVDLSVAPFDDESGQRMGAVVILRDARTRLENESRLRASEERFRTAFDHAPLGMALLSFDGLFLQVNAAFCKLLGYEARDLLGHQHARVTDSQDHAHELLQLGSLETGQAQVVQFEKRYLTLHPARQVWVLVSASVLHGQGLSGCYLYQVHDLTEQRRAAERVAELAAERMRREASELIAQGKDEFLARVSHEMRTPLNAILGFAQLLQMQYGKTENNLPKFVEQIISAGQHLTAMVDDLLDIQVASEGRLSLTIQMVDIGKAIQHAFALLDMEARTRQVELISSAPRNMLFMTDETRLRQILLNVISNAVKYNHPHGRVTVDVEALPDQAVHITVSDTGLGMSSEQLEGLFHPFDRLGKERSNIPGVGLGLVVSRRIVESLGGKLNVSSQPDAGTEVMITLPITQPTPSESIKAST